MSFLNTYLNGCLPQNNVLVSNATLSYYYKGNWKDRYNDVFSSTLTPVNTKSFTTLGKARNEIRCSQLYSDYACTQAVGTIIDTFIVYEPPSGALDTLVVLQTSTIYINDELGSGFQYSYSKNYKYYGSGPSPTTEIATLTCGLGQYINVKGGKVTTYDPGYKPNPDRIATITINYY